MESEVPLPSNHRTCDPLGEREIQDSCSLVPVLKPHGLKYPKINNCSIIPW